MKCMNPEGLLVENMQKTKNFDIPLTPEIKAEFRERLVKMVEYYQNSSHFKELVPTMKTAGIPTDKDINTVGWLTQFRHVMVRGFKDTLRNPLDVRMKLYINIFLAFIGVIVFRGVLINIF